MQVRRGVIALHNRASPSHVAQAAPGPTTNMVKSWCCSTMCRVLSRFSSPRRRGIQSSTKPLSGNSHKSRVLSRAVSRAKCKRECNSSSRGSSAGSFRWRGICRRWQSKQEPSLDEDWADPWASRAKCESNHESREGTAAETRHASSWIMIALIWSAVPTKDEDHIIDDGNDR